MILPKKLAIFVGWVERSETQQKTTNYLNCRLGPCVAKPNKKQCLNRLGYCYKSEDTVKQIIDYLDYEFLYLHLIKTVKNLHNFIQEIDSFLVETTITYRPEFV